MVLDLACGPVMCTLERWSSTNQLISLVGSPSWWQSITIRFSTQRHWNRSLRVVKVFLSSALGLLEVPKKADRMWVRTMINNPTQPHTFRLWFVVTSCSGSLNSVRSLSSSNLAVLWGSNLWETWTRLASSTFCFFLELLFVSVLCDTTCCSSATYAEVRPPTVIHLIVAGPPDGCRTQVTKDPDSLPGYKKAYQLQCCFILLSLAPSMLEQPVLWKFAIIRIYRDSNAAHFGDLNVKRGYLIRR